MAIDRMQGMMPFVAQRPVGNHLRTCGAATLSMIYASFGMQHSYKQIWHRIAAGLACDSPVGSHRLAFDALESGFEAIVLKANRPWEALQRVSNSGRRCIVNHRLARDSAEGHFSVIVGVDQSGVVVHDPTRRSASSISKPRWLELWGGTDEESEHRGNVLIAIRPSNRYRIDELICPRCHVAMPLAADLGLSAANWDECWECVFCPQCDTSLRSD